MLTWSGYVSSSNYYQAEAIFRKVQSDSGRSDDSTAANTEAIAIVNPNDPCELKRWCGDKRYGNEDDTIKHYASHPVYVQVVNTATQIGVPDKYVTFTTSGGSQWYQQNYTISASLIGSGSDEVVDGLAWTHLIVDSAGTYTVTASYGGYSQVFYLYCVVDSEEVGDDSLIHECWDDTLSPQITGDGYWSADPSNTLKNLKIEVDYDGGVVSSSVLQKALDLVKDSIYPEVNVSIQYWIDDNAYVGNILNRSHQKQVLWGSRDSSGIGTAYLHVFFADMYMSDSTNLRGKAVTYSDEFEENIGLTTCAKLGSGDLSITNYSQDYLDSVGCMIFVRPSCRYIPNTFIDSAHVLALIAAHEIGHALGLGHLSTPEYLNHGIMSYTFNISLNSSYDDYAHFKKPLNDDYVYRWLINLRKVLSRETVDINI